MSIIQMSKIVDTCTCIYSSVLPLIYPYTTPHRQFYAPLQNFTAGFLTPFQPLTACTLSLYLTLLSDPYPFQHCIVPSLPFYNTSSLTPNHYATPHRPLLIIFNTLMFSVQHLTAFLNLLKHPTPPPVLYPFSTHQVLSFPYPFTKHHRPIFNYPFTAPHRPFLTPLQHLTAGSLPIYNTYCLSGSLTAHSLFHYNMLVPYLCTTPILYPFTTPHFLSCTPNTTPHRQFLTPFSSTRSVMVSWTADRGLVLRATICPLYSAVRVKFRLTVPVLLQWSFRENALLLS